MKYSLLCAIAVLTCEAYGQNKITGVVTDADGKLPYANVLLKHKTIGTLTDEQGLFVIEANPTDTLVVSSIGYKTKEIRVGNLQHIDVMLSDYEALDEVVITVDNGIVEKTHTILCYSHTGCGIVCTTEVVYERAKVDLVNVFPNPSKTGIFNLKSTKDFSDVELVVADLMGRIVLRKSLHKLNTYIIDLSGQPSGIYVMGIASKGEHFTSKKLVVK